MVFAVNVFSFGGDRFTFFSSRQFVSCPYADFSSPRIPAIDDATHTVFILQGVGCCEGFAHVQVAIYGDFASWVVILRRRLWFITHGFGRTTRNGFGIPSLISVARSNRDIFATFSRSQGVVCPGRIVNEDAIGKPLVANAAIR